MIALLAGAAVADTPVDPVDPGVAVLWVGIHRDAGTLADVAADGASGLCTAVDTWIRCPAAAGPVTFRWGRSGSDFRLYARGADGAFASGPIVVPAGQGAVGFVLADEAARAGELARLAFDVVTATEVRDQFVSTSAHPVFAPSPGQVVALAALTRHPDPLVRRELPDALLPLLRHTAQDPLPLGAPPLVPAGTLTALARDRDPVVRRRVAGRMRDVRDGGVAADEVAAALHALVSSGGAAQRAALVSMASRSKEGSAPALDAWRIARERMRDPGPPGRAAVKTLAALSTELEPGGEVDPAAAVHDCVSLHPERAWSLWNAWRRAVPFDPLLAGRLLRETVGWSPALLTWWARTEPDALAAAFVAWEPGPPHTPRYLDLLTGLALLPDPRWSALRGDKLSAPQDPPPAP